MGYHIVAEQAHGDPPPRKARTPALPFVVKYSHGDPIPMEDKNPALHFAMCAHACKMLERFEQGDEILVKNSDWHR